MLEGREGRREVGMRAVGGLTGRSEARRQAEERHQSVSLTCKAGIQRVGITLGVSSYFSRRFFVE